MLYLEIKNLGKFTALLFAGDSFDTFLLHDAQFETAFTSVIEGRKNEAYFSEEEQKEETESFASWAEIRPIAYSLLKGKKLPVSFKVTLLTDKKATETLVERSGFTGCPVSSLLVSFSYRENRLVLRSGVSYNGFSMDRSLENSWDEALVRFLEKKEIEFETPDA